MKYIVTINDNSYEVEVERGKAIIVGTNNVVSTVVKKVGGENPVAQVTTTQPVAQKNGLGEPLKAPMPGIILDIKVTQEAIVKKGDVVLILEAMKMENEITATKDGVVKEILVTKGELVATNDVLVRIQ